MMTLPSSYSSPPIEEMPPRPRSRRSWRERVRPACRGIKLGVRGHSRFFVYFFCAALVLAAAIVLRCDLVQWCLLLGCIGMVLITELLNSAVIALVRALDDDSRSRAAPCLDIALGAVLLAVLTAAVIGCCVFLSRLIDACAP
jgi:diacylglycerol kinase